MNEAKVNDSRLNHSILMIGAGGLGAPALLGLADAGVRKIGIVDPDRVEESNLHRQILYRESDIGRAKAEVARERLVCRFPDIEARAYVERFGATSSAMLKDYDLVLDGTDQFETKILISDICTDLNLAYVFAGVIGTDGQVMAVKPKKSACLRCLFDEDPGAEAAMTCDVHGVLGPIAGMVAAEQVRRGLALLAGDASVLNALWSYEGQTAKTRTIRLPKADDCRGCGTRKHLRDERINTEVEVRPLGDTDNEDAVVLSLTHAVCPETYIETKKALDKLSCGEKLWVHLSSDESARNVPVSAVAAGYQLLSRYFDGDTHRLLFTMPRKG